MDQTFLEIEVIIRRNGRPTFGNILHGNAELAQIVARDVQDHVAIVKVGGVLTTVAKRNRPSALG
jgi:hypothetical protein